MWTIVGFEIVGLRRILHTLKRTSLSTSLYNKTFLPSFVVTFLNYNQEIVQVVYKPNKRERLTAWMRAVFPFIRLGGFFDPEEGWLQRVSIH